VTAEEYVTPDDDLDHSFYDLALALDLNPDVPSVGLSVQHRVDATVEQWQENMQETPRLLDLVRPDLELQRLTWTARVTPAGHDPVG